ncbi:MAG: septum site-determining protein MinD [candidate division Zixibacteria bacterium]|nr:septum site-determining protein MinD [candidate division Zixibacteria bacterium]
MACRTIVVTSGKGGVGKTTSTANIGTGLALLGRKVVVVDTDIGLRNLDVIMGLENRIVYDLVQVIEGLCELRQAMIRDRKVEGLFLIPAAQTRDKSAVNLEQMKALCERIKEEIEPDYLILDSPAGIEQGFRNALAAAEEAIVVTTPEVSAIQDADRVISLIEANAGMRPRLIINRLRPQMIEEGNMMDIPDILELLAVQLLGIVPEDEDIIVSSNQGVPIVHNQERLAGKAYRNIVARLEGQEIPLLSLNSRKGIWDRFKKFLGG